jgi:rSAM/selenodomain-associated transferase 1
MRRGCICIFAKPPIAGTAKTRLAPAVGPEGAARLAEAFLLDTWALVSALDWARPIVATTGSLPEALGIGARESVWPQGEGDLGNRIERVLVHALGQAPWAMALGGDSPGLPARRLEDARRALESSDAVLGPSEDGGFYLLGLRRCPARLLEGLPWSEVQTFERTIERLRERGLETQVLDPWFDVDVPEDLDRLRARILCGEVVAPRTERVMASYRQ